MRLSYCRYIQPIPLQSIGDVKVVRSGTLGSSDERE